MKVLVTIPLLLLAGICFGTIIPNNLRTIWQGNIGVPGGVTNRTVIFANVKNPPYNAVGNGIADDTAAIQAALDACPSEQIVFVPAGTYNVSALYIKGPYTLRGAGAASTTINGLGANTYSTIYFGDGSGQNWAEWAGQGTDVTAGTAITSGATNYSTTLTVASAAGISVGRFLFIDCLDDGGTNWIPADLVNMCGSENNSCTRGTCRFLPDKVTYVDGGQRNRMEIVQITGVSGTTITIAPLLPQDMPLSPVASAFSIPTTGAGVQYAGLENLKVVQNNTGTIKHSSAVVMWRCAFCWVKGIEVYYPDGDYIQSSSSFRCEYRDSYFHDGWDHGPGGSDVCVRITQGSSFHLIENNIIRRSHEGIMMDYAGGCHVVGYNYITNNFTDNCLDCMIAQLDYHGKHIPMVLWEGNVANLFNQDGGWGSASHGTVFRNFLSGDNWSDPPYDTGGPEQTNGPWTHPQQYHWCLNLANNSKYFNIVGNVMGVPSILGINGFTSIYTNVWPTMIPRYAYGLAMSFGYGGGSDTGTESMDNALPYTTALIAGNWDIVNKTQVWSTNTDHALPNSYYLASRPAFFGGMGWPAVEPSTWNTNNTAPLIPAEWLWYYGTNPPPQFPPTATNVHVIAIGPAIAKGAVIIK